MLFSSVKHILKFILTGCVSVILTLTIVLVIYLDGRTDLKVWHEAELDAEYTAESPVKTFEEYLSLEKRLFSQLDEKVYDCIEPSDRRLINRYYKGSLADPGKWDTNWNCSFELPSDNPKAAVLLLHGMSDSPYSLRNLGQKLNSRGAWVVGLRLPGHGTAPAGLVEVSWEDMAGAVRLGVNRLQDQAGNTPFYIIGYSNGGALAIHYALLSLKDPVLPKADGLVLISPAIGVSKLAALAVWQARIGHFLGLEKLAWNSILPEYDPFKYQSFAVNAGDQVYRLTEDIRRHMEILEIPGAGKDFPPVLAFQSAADATVSTRAVIDSLFAKLPRGKAHELVVFDINRNSETTQIIVKDPGRMIDAIFAESLSSFTISMLTNSSEDSSRVVLRQKRQGEEESTVIPLELKWPEGIYSLSHVALSFPPDDPLYGGPGAANEYGMNLGNTAFRGERGLLQIPAADMLRLRWNPFYSYLEKKLVTFTNLK